MDHVGLLASAPGPHAAPGQGFGLWSRRVVIADPDVRFARELTRHLQRAGFACLNLAHSAGPSVLIETAPDLVLLASAAPLHVGTGMCRPLRDAGYLGGLIVLAENTSEVDLVAGLDAGADDFVSKTVAAAELVARLRALVRLVERQRWNAHHVSYGPSELVVNPIRGEVVFDGTSLNLGHRQVDVLYRLLRRRGMVVSRAHLMPAYFSAKALDVTVGRLRTNLTEAGVPLTITNVRGRGFRLSDT